MTITNYDYDDDYELRLRMTNTGTHSPLTAGRPFPCLRH